MRLQLEPAVGYPRRLNVSTINHCGLPISKEKGMQCDFSIEIPNGAIVLSPNFYIGERRLEERSFLLQIKFFDQSNNVLNTEDAGLAYSKKYDSDYVYLGVSQENIQILTSRRIRPRVPVYRAELTVLPWKADKETYVAFLPCFSTLYLSGRSVDSKHTWTIVKGNEIGR